ncbi:unnamed protein product [Diabrotica balteata]|uniref:Regulatory protein zeste n=1 Tax=Diabrotica balteata TaxID=107213 RepID=A0A9N9TG35_DIABA|nr:unnamed protein product [Diabrotica balteata]
MAKRVSNFSKTEEKVLLDLVYKYKDYLECKKTDMTNNKMKWDAWMKLAKEFNSVSGETVRDVKVLKNKYENLKKRTKQKFAELKRYSSGTGGGLAKTPIFTDSEEVLQDIIGPQITGLLFSYDYDSSERKMQEVSASKALDIYVYLLPSTSGMYIHFTYV